MPRSTRAAVSVPVSLPAGYREAVTAFLAGENGRVIEILGAIKTSMRSRVDVELLRARTHLRLREYTTCIAILNGIENERMSHNQAAVRAFLSLTASFRSGARAQALPELEAGFRQAQASPAIHLTVKAEAAYFYAVALLAEWQLDEALTIAKESLANASDIVEVRILELLGWIEIAREVLDSAGDWFVAGLQKFQQCEHRDVGVLASLVHGTTMLAVETLNPKLIAAAKEYAPTVAWAASDRWRQTQVGVCLGRIAETEGDNETAFDYFEYARLASADSFFCTFGIIAEANLLKHVGERFAAGRALKEVERLFKPVVWSDTNAEERVALLMYVFAKADYDVALASKALIKARSIWEKDDPLITVARDDRLSAYFLQASGAVRVARGELEDGIRDLRTAFEIWARYKYVVHGANVGLLLWNLTKEEAYKEYVESVARKIPQSWIARKIGYAASSVLAKLSVAERRVLDLLLQGHAESEIATKTHRSVHTIKNQRKSLFKKLGVRSKAELFVVAQRSGLSIVNAVGVPPAPEPVTPPKPAKAVQRRRAS